MIKQPLSFNLTYVFFVSLFASVALAQPAQPNPYVPVGDGVPLSQVEAKVFTQALCTSGLFRTREGCSQTGANVLELGNNNIAYGMDFVVYSSLSRVGAQDALLGLSTLATDSGDTSAVFFQRDGTRWRAVRFLQGGVRQTILTFPARDGRTLVVSYGEGFETSTFDLQVTSFDGSDVRTSLLLDYRNPFPSCNRPPAAGARHAQVVSWKQEDRNGDGYPDLVLDMAMLRIDAFPCYASQAFYKATQHRQKLGEEVVFLFDGQEFTATPGAERLKLFSQAPQGYTNTR